MSSDVPPCNILVIGSAACVHNDLAAIDRCGICIDFRIYVNGAMRLAPEGLGSNGTCGCTLHPDMLPQWTASLNPDKYRHRIIAESMHEPKDCILLPLSQWKNCFGGSGLLAVRAAIEIFNADRVILAGMPLSRQPHFYDNGTLEPYLEGYREGWLRADREHHIGKHVESCSGWTRAQFGAPPELLTGVE